VGFWVQRILTKKVPFDQHVMRLHLAAESVTAGALIAGGIATFADARAPATLVTVGLGLGLLVYAAVQSPAFYPDERETRAFLWMTLAATAIVFVLRVATL
ncbi:MAG TPA: hypothetical protein VGW79_08245, partial [Actinomycetota bacterium]|nr:hypothetical protein [Actinomycetota bacterium]